MIIVLRLLHVVLGVYWAGTLIFIATFLEPSIRAALPESGKVQAQLLQRRFLDIMPVVAALTILSGIELSRRDSGGFAAGWIGSGTGLALTIGGLSAIAAFVIGVFIMRRAQLRAFALAQSLPQLEPAAKEALQAEIQRMRRVVTVSVRWVALLLAVSVIGMAVARYV
jgi:uncharacterized membrane protein